MSTRVERRNHMFRYTTPVVAALAAFPFGPSTPAPTLHDLAHWRMAPAAARVAAANLITITNRSGVVQTNYPLQFGRPFLPGAITGQPQVLINGKPVSTQADVKNRWPDGSVKFAVIAVAIPTIPASGSL